ncbi:MAG: antibiotic biosynthesis monooxygenase family protein [Saprospiraceae bacterium]|nr:antibiotic biosynthesis monooxygenase family protein [Saprospiraceae bacterium]
MIHRIVKMTFRADEVSRFLEFFDSRKSRIIGFQGCQSLKLLQDSHSPNVIFTLSVWDDESDLESYRRSDLFKETWKVTKSMFEERARAWSTNCLAELYSDDDSSNTNPHNS